MVAISRTLLVTLFTSVVSMVRAEMIPTSPDASTIARIGSQLTTLWTKDNTGVWNDVSIQLMTGDNFQMIPVSTLETGIDATTLEKYTFTVPEVTPTSRIYFLQFKPNTGNASQVTWTTRFTIAGADGSTTAPASQTQPDGQAIPWGVGSLVNGASDSTANNATDVSPASSNITTAAIVTGASSTASALVVASASTSSPAQVVAAATTDVVSSAAAMVTTRATTSGPVAASAASASTTARTGSASKVQTAGLGLVGSLGLLAVLMV